MQGLLAQFCRSLDAGGAKFMFSNSDTPFIRGLYAGYRIRNGERCAFQRVQIRQTGK